VNGGVVGRDGDGLRTVRRRRHDDRVGAQPGLAQRYAAAASMSGRLPLHPGNGVAGRVMATEKESTAHGSDERSWRIQVAHGGGAGYTEQKALVPADNLLPVPDGLDL
jgi:NADPH:quinone reductase-like Zn-dependent oxidoreductase